MSEATINLDEFRLHDKDSGSSDVQIAKLTERIIQLTAHMEANKKDFSTRRGLLRLVARRRKLLDYLKRTNDTRYQALLKSLSLRR